MNMCYEPRNDEFAKVCRERDELKAAYDGAKLAMKALNEKLVQVTAERDALEKIVGESSFNCEYCKHVGVLQGCGFDGPCWECVEPEKCVCGRCKSGSMFEYRGVEADHG
jgi:hypothetical protein